MQTVRAGRSRAAMQTVWTQTCEWAAAAHWRSCHTVLILLGSNTSCVHHKKGCRAYCRETMQTFPRCKFRNVDLHRKKRSGYCIRREKTLITLLCKVRVVKHRCINKWSGFVSHWSKRKNAGSELSHVRVIKGNTYQQGNRLWHNTRAASIEWMPVRSLLFYLSFSFSLSLPLRLLCLHHQRGSLSFAVKSLLVIPVVPQLPNRAWWKAD